MRRSRPTADQLYAASVLSRAMMRRQVQDDTAADNSEIECRMARRKRFAAVVVLVAAIAFLLLPIAILCAQLTVSSTTGKRPYKILADVPRGAWFRNKAFDDESIELGLSWGTRYWVQVVAVDHEPPAAVILSDRRRVTPAELSERWVFTRDPFVPFPIEWPCLLNSESGDGL